MHRYFPEEAIFRVDDWLAGATTMSTLRVARLGRAGASEDELTATAARARLLPWINSLPLGWDTRVGTRTTARSPGAARMRS